ncbi:MAG: sigma factor-like helix-turn-helix DNA-binding protein [Tissierellia bacterium]|nr:sigma factor-like helix-turn-helix DNA-binding protein [Tissierellia bacterium]
MIRYFEVGTLYEFYKNLLTEKQRNCVDLYYNNDYTMQEIADEMGITKQAVSLTIRKAVNKLDKFEDCLRFAKTFFKIEDAKDDIKRLHEKVVNRSDVPEDIKDDIFVLLSNIEKMED